MLRKSLHAAYWLRLLPNSDEKSTATTLMNHEVSSGGVEYLQDVDGLPKRQKSFRNFKLTPT